MIHIFNKSYRVQKLLINLALPVLFFVLFVSVGHAQTPPPAPEPCGPGALCLRVDNPLRTNDFWGFLSIAMDLAIKIGVPIAVIFFIWAGFQYILARGDTKKISLAHNNLQNVVIGTIIFLGAWTITMIVVNTFQSVVGTV